MFDKGLDFMRDAGKQAMSKVNGRMRRVARQAHLNA